MLEKMKDIGLLLLAIVTAIFGGYAFFQKRRADKKEKKIDDLENEMQANDINNEVKEFQAINKERKDVADEKLDKKLDDLDRKLNGNSVY